MRLRAAPVEPVARPRVLLVDDEPLVLSSYQRVLRSLPIEVLSAQSPILALALLERHPIDVLIADFRMPEMAGDEFLEEARERWPDTVRLLNSGHADLPALEEVVRRGGIFRFLMKPCEPEKLRAAVSEALAEAARISANRKKADAIALDRHSFREVFQTALDPMMIADLTGRLLDVNRAFVAQNGATRVEALRIRPTITATWSVDDRWQEIRESLLAKGHWSAAVHHQLEDRHALLSISVIRDGEQHYALAAIEKDVSTRHRLEEQSRAAQYEVILALAKLAEYRDPETGAHLERFRCYSQALARELARNPRYLATIDDEYVEAIFSSSPLHDIGKVGIPDEVLLKPGKLTAKELEVMQLHSTIGGEVLFGAGRTLSAKNWLTMARTIALEHHEKFDGTGYPRGLKGEEIDLAARITALADAYDAITSKRVYKPALPHEEARRRILESSGTHFDPEVVAAFIACEPEFIRIRDEHNEGTETRQYLAVSGDGVSADGVSADTAMFRRIEQLIDTSAGRRS
jgi:PAS domain S-box-containing protein